MQNFDTEESARQQLRAQRRAKLRGKEKTGTKKKTDPGIELYGAGSDNSSDSGWQIDRRKEESS